MLPRPTGETHDGLGRLPENVLAPLVQQSQLDFDLAFFEQVLQRSPNYVDVLRCQGELLARKGLHQRSLGIDRRLVQLVPGDPVAHYNLACSLALTGSYDDAIQRLRRALDLGYDNLEGLLVDTDLESLRDCPEFAELLASIVDRLEPEGIGPDDSCPDGDLE
jgi:tetratricopeptide (TPR) repeat protein